MRHHIRYFVISIFMLVLMSTLTIADSGCFLDLDSPRYCQQLDSLEAEFECSLTDDCDLATSFAESKRCSLFEECQQILCKSTCSLTFAGLCLSGEVPAGEEDLWCKSEGCCQYWPDSAEPSCDIKDNKWRCHIAASNVGVDYLNWDQSKDADQCVDSCLSDSYPYHDKLEDFRVNYYSKAQNEIQDSQLSSSTKTVEGNSKKTDQKKEFSNNSGNQDNQNNRDITTKLINLLAPYFLVFILILILIFFYEHRHFFTKHFSKLRIKSKMSLNLKSKKKKIGTSNPTQNPVQKSTQNNIIQHHNGNGAFESTSHKKDFTHHHKLHQHQKKIQLELDQAFSEYKPAKLESKSGLEKLQGIIKQHQKKQRRRKKHQDRLAVKNSNQQK